MDYQLGPGPLQVDQNTTDEKIKGDIGIVENGDIATHAILKNYYVIWKGNLYKAKSDISSGTTLSAESNGNLEPKSNGIGGEVAALNSKMIGYIDTNTVLLQGDTAQTWTATDNGWVFIGANGDGGTGLTVAYINNGVIFRSQAYANQWNEDIFPIKKGQKLRIDKTGTSNIVAYTVYGMLY